MSAQVAAEIAALKLGAPIVPPSADTIRYIIARAVDKHVVKYPARREDVVSVVRSELRMNRLPAGVPDAIMRSFVEIAARRDRRMARRRLEAESQRSMRQRALEVAQRIAGPDAYACLCACEYRQSSSRWAGGDHTIKVTFAETPGAHGYSVKEKSANGKWSGTSSVIEVRVTLAWLRVDALGLSMTERKGAYVFVVSVGDERQDGSRPCVYVAQGRGFDVYLTKGTMKEGVIR